MKIFNQIQLLLFISLFISCTDNESVIDIDSCVSMSSEPEFSEDEYVKFFENHQKWICHDIRDYEFRIFNTGMIYLFESALVTVRNGQFESIEYEEANVDIETIEQIIGTPTFDAYFRIIEEAVTPNTPDTAESVRSEYDAEFGFPVDVYIDYVLIIADEERYLRIADFKML